MQRFNQIFVLALALCFAPGRTAQAEGTTVVSLDDPAGDDYGPGSYVPPTDGEFVDGDFDLRHFSVVIEGRDAVFEVTLGAGARLPHVTQRSQSSEVKLDNGIYLQNIDIYLDTDASSTEGLGTGLPGRRIAFAGGRTWKRAVVLTPQPGPARGVIESELGKNASRVIFIQGVQQRGRALIGRVPLVALGAVPTASWGYSVQVSGARWDRSFAIVDRLRGTREADAFTMPVLTVPDQWAFGGAPEGELHPRVLDVLLPPGVSQRTVLGSFNLATGAWARVPFVYPAPPPSASAAAPAPGATGATAPGTGPHGPAVAQPPPLAGSGIRPLQLQLAPSNLPPPPAPHEGLELTVAFVAGNMISLSGKPGILKPLQFGRVIGPNGTQVARVVIVQVVETGLVVNAVEGEQHIAPGMKVRFDAP